MQFLDMLASVLVEDEGTDSGHAVAAASAASERHSPSELAWRRKRVALRGVALTLTRQQGCMLEQIVDEIHVPDRAMEEVAGEYGDDGSGFFPA